MMVGMNPNIVPLGKYINQDLHESVDWYVNITSHLSDQHEHNFSKHMSKILSRAYTRVWDITNGEEGVLSSRDGNRWDAGVAL